MRIKLGKILLLSLIPIFLLLVSIVSYPQLANSIMPSDICPKHDFSTGEYTSCYYCHNAETEGEVGFTINTDSTNCLSCHDGSTMDSTSAYTTLGSIAE